LYTTYDDIFNKTDILLNLCRNIFKQASIFLILLLNKVKPKLNFKN